MKKFTPIACSAGFLFGGLLSLNCFAYELVLKVDEITAKKGVMMVALFNSEETYSSDKQTFSGQKVLVNANTITINFGDVPSGDYAIKLYQDENENGVIDKNVVGMPTEGYGFSNNGGAMGQPKFEAAKFSVNADTAITIHLR